MMRPQDIARLRKQKGLSVTALARLAGVSRMTVYHWEDGTFSPTEESLARLEACFSDDPAAAPSKTGSLLDRLEDLERDFKDVRVSPDTGSGRISPGVRRTAASVLASLKNLIKETLR